MEAIWYYLFILSQGLSMFAFVGFILWWVYAASVAKDKRETEKIRAIVREEIK